MDEAGILKMHALDELVAAAREWRLCRNRCQASRSARQGTTASGQGLVEHDSRNYDAAVRRLERALAGLEAVGL